MIAGVDLGGRRCHIAILGNDVAWPEFYAFDEPKTDRMLALQAAAVWARRVLDRSLLNVIWIEEPRGAHHRSIYQLSMMAGVVLASVPPSVSIEMVPAGECRKLVGLKGNAAKSEIIEWAEGQLALDSPARGLLNEHMADAYVVSRAIIAHGERGA